MNTTQLRVTPTVLRRDLPLDYLHPQTLIPSTGITRRVQALAARGWPATAVAERLAISDQQLGRWQRKSFITVEKHWRVADLYEQIWDVSPPCDEKTVRVTMRRAQAAGWVPPLAWDDIDTDPGPYVPDAEDGPVLDMVAIELAVEGHPVALTQEERLLAVTHLNGRGFSDNAIAHMLQVTGRTILRDRTALGLPAAVGFDNLPIDHHDDSQGVAA